MKDMRRDGLIEGEKKESEGSRGKRGDYQF